MPPVVTTPQKPSAATITTPSKQQQINKVLSGRVCYVDGTGATFKEKKVIQDLITSSGATHTTILNQKSTADQDEKPDIYLDNLPFNMRKAIKLNIPITTRQYIDDSIVFGSLLSAAEYSLVSLYNLREHHYKSLDFSDLLGDQAGNGGGATSDSNRPLKRITFSQTTIDPSAPTFPEDRYHIVKYNMLQDARSRFACIELHVAGGALALVRSGSEAAEQDAASPSFFRVFVHEGHISSADSSPREWIAASSMEEGLAIYNRLFLEFIGKQFHKILISRSSVGSDRLQSDGVAMTRVSQLAQPVQDLVTLLYNEAITALGARLGSAPKLTLAPEGTLQTSLGTIALPQVEKAEFALHQLVSAVRADSDSIGSSHVAQLLSEFYAALPQARPPNNAAPTVDLIADLQELIQLMKDILVVGESLGVSTATSNVVDTRYRAMRCNIEPLDNTSKEYKKLHDQTSNDNMRIKNIYRIGRREEESLQFSIHNVKTLYHGSRNSNILGILTRGLLPPKLSTSLGASRRDVGFLGSGIYFGTKSATSLQYCDGPTSRGLKYMVLCQVALGNVKKYTTHQTQLNEAPKGFHSVQGVATASSAFKDDEIVVFDAKQQRVQYLVEFEDVASGSMALLKAPLFTVSNETRKATLDSDDAVENSVPPPSKEEVEEVKEAGLIAGGANVPLQAVHVRAKLLDLIGEVTLFQHYRNESTRAIEAKYVFPLDEMSAVCGFEAYINGKHIVGECKEKERAHREYKQAIAEGHGAYLMDEEKPDVFTVSVGNLPPKAEVLIKIIYITELSLEGLDIAFVLPASIAPARRTLAAATQTQDRTSTVVTDDAAADLTIEVGVEMPYNIVKLVSPSHDIRIKKTHTKATVSLASAPPTTRNFTLLVGLEDPYSPRMWVEVDNRGHHASMLAFYPKMDIEGSDGSPLQLTLLVDLSASMAGDPFNDMLRALRLTVANLRGMNVRFNIVQFGDVYDWLFVESVPPTEEHLQLAWAHINALRPSYGGTQLAQPLSSLALIAAAKSQRDAPHNILLFTDGHVADEPRVQELIARSSKNVRVFAMGVGDEVSRHFIKSIARISGGFAEFLAPNKRPNPKKIVAQLQRIVQPAMRNVRVVFDSSDTGIVQSPSTIPSIFRRERQVVYAFSGLATRATLAATAPGGGQVSNAVHTPDIGFLRGSLIHRLAARSMIRDYSDGVYSDSKIAHDLIKIGKKDDIIELSLRYGIVTQFTSFVAVERREKGEVSNMSPEAASKQLLAIVAEIPIDSLPYVAWEERGENDGVDINDSTLSGKRTQLIALINQYSAAAKHDDSVRVFHQIADTYGSYTNDELELLGQVADKLVAKNTKIAFAPIPATATTTLAISRAKREQQKAIDAVRYDVQGLLRLVEASIAKSETSDHTVVLLAREASLYETLIKCERNDIARTNLVQRTSQMFDKVVERAVQQLPPTHPTRLRVIHAASTFMNEHGNQVQAITLLKSAFDNAISELDCLSEDSYQDSTLMLQTIRDDLENYTTVEEARLLPSSKRGGKDQDENLRISNEQEVEQVNQWASLGGVTVDHFAVSGKKKPVAAKLWSEITEEDEADEGLEDCASDESYSSESDESSSDEHDVGQKGFIRKDTSRDAFAYKWSVNQVDSKPSSRKEWFDGDAPVQVNNKVEAHLLEIFMAEEEEEAHLLVEIIMAEEDLVEEEDTHTSEALERVEEYLLLEEDLVEEEDTLERILAIDQMNVVTVIAQILSTDVTESEAREQRRSDSRESTGSLSQYQAYLPSPTSPSNSPIEIIDFKLKYKMEEKKSMPKLKMMEMSNQASLTPLDEIVITESLLSDNMRSMPKFKSIMAKESSPLPPPPPITAPTTTVSPKSSGSSLPGFAFGAKKESAPPPPRDGARGVGPVGNSAPQTPSPARPAPKAPAAAPIVSEAPKLSGMFRRVSQSSSQVSAPPPPPPPAYPSQQPSFGFGVAQSQPSPFGQPNAFGAAAFSSIPNNTGQALGGEQSSPFGSSPYQPSAFGAAPPPPSASTFGGMFGATPPPPSTPLTFGGMFGGAPPPAPPASCGPPPPRASTSPSPSRVSHQKDQQQQQNQQLAPAANRSSLLSTIASGAKQLLKPTFMRKEEESKEEKKHEVLSNMLAGALSRRSVVSYDDDEDGDDGDDNWGCELNEPISDLKSVMNESISKMVERSECLESLSSPMYMNAPKRAIEVSDGSSQDMGFDMFGDYGVTECDVRAVPAAECSLRQSIRESSDNDMGFGLFGDYDDEPTPVPVAAAAAGKSAPPFDKRSQMQCESEEEEEEVEGMDFSGLFDMGEGYDYTPTREISRSRLSKKVSSDECIVNPWMVQESTPICEEKNVSKSKKKRSTLSSSKSSLATKSISAPTTQPLSAVERICQRLTEILNSNPSFPTSPLAAEVFMLLGISISDEYIKTLKKDLYGKIIIELIMLFLEFLRDKTPIITALHSRLYNENPAPSKNTSSPTVMCIRRSSLKHLLK
eukprot:gene3432-3897_t